jgi:hypothetical protein
MENKFENMEDIEFALEQKVVAPDTLQDDRDVGLAAAHILRSSESFCGEVCLSFIIFRLWMQRQQLL